FASRRSPVRSRYAPSLFMQPAPHFGRVTARGGSPANPSKGLLTQLVHRTLLTSPCISRNEAVIDSALGDESGLAVGLSLASGAGWRQGCCVVDERLLGGPTHRWSGSCRDRRPRTCCRSRRRPQSNSRLGS